jgi:diguanylate cyclase (GGDEF)-like protein
MARSDTTPPQADQVEPLKSDGGAAPAPAIDASRIVASVGELPYEWRVDTDRLNWGDRASDVLGIADMATIATGRGFAQLLDPHTPVSRFDVVMGSTEADKGSGVFYQLKYSLRPAGPSGAPLWIEDIGRWFAGADGKPSYAHGIVRVINDRHAQEQQLTYLSQFDALTGEMNRWRLTDNLSSALADAIKFRSTCGFLLVAVDNLTRINEAYGYDVADEVIASVGKRLRAKMRGVDVLGRFSGNKFGVVLHKCTLDDMRTAAERLLAGVRDDVVQTKVGPVAVTATIGGVVAPRHARTVEEILARSHEALNAAKAKRRGSFQPYRPNIEREEQRRQNQRASDEIISALNEKRVLLAFEPVVDTAQRTVAFHECLMRIRRGDGTIVTAQNIIPVAEHLGFVRLIDHRVLHLVIAELAANPAFKASINASPLSAIDPDWWATLTTQLRMNSSVAQRLIIEITETAAIQDIDDTRGFVARVKDLGCRIAIDDFGAGYTSFRNLRKLGVDIVKIDGAFVENMVKSEDDSAFVLTLLDLARRLKLQTVAERVPDENTARALAEAGCDYLQGKLIGLAQLERPLAGAA